MNQERSNFHSTPCRKKLHAHFERMRDVQMRDLFKQDPERFDKYSIECCDILLDFSKNQIIDETLGLLTELAHESGLPEWQQRLLSGGEVNLSEHRAALHTALRRPASTPLMVGGRDVMRDIAANLARMRTLSDELRSGHFRGASGEVIQDVVSLGIGGSHLGPAMACRALENTAAPLPSLHFASGADELKHLLTGLNPARTLFIVISKGFSTRETLDSAARARDWVGEAHTARHFIAVSSNADAVAHFGIPPQHHLLLPDSVGGRYSLCSAAGLPLAIRIGMDGFEEMLRGAHAMDEHFEHAPLAANMPVILALLDVWYGNFHGAQSRAVLPYNSELELFPAYLQQLEMESNGKSVDREGRGLNFDTAPVTWGGPAIEGQHAFYQLLHQGTRLVPADLIISASSSPNPWLYANFFAQSHILMQGHNDADARRAHPGSRPANAIMLRELSPATIGALAALYEHKVFTAAVAWGINPFDQWGVEFGKQTACEIFDGLAGTGEEMELDASTRGLIRKYREWH